ncbi:MAG: hypothetical protein AAGH57_12475 [Pseudomonadota bacterium]
MQHALISSRWVPSLSAGHHTDLARKLIVLGCAAALILAGQPLPYMGIVPAL